MVDFENFDKSFTFLGGKKTFFLKCPNNSLVSEQDQKDLLNCQAQGQRETSNVPKKN